MTYSQLRNPKPPFLNVRIICWNTIWTVNYIFIISYFVGISFFSLRNWKGLTLTFSCRSQALGETDGRTTEGQRVIGVWIPESHPTRKPVNWSTFEFWIHLLLTIGFLDVEFVTGDCEWKGWGLGWKLMKRRLRLKCSNIIKAFSECAHIERWGFHPWNRKIPSLGKAEQLIWTMPCLQRKKQQKMGLRSIYQQKLVLSSIYLGNL